MRKAPTCTVCYVSDGTTVLAETVLSVDLESQPGSEHGFGLIFRVNVEEGKYIAAACSKHKGKIIEGMTAIRDEVIRNFITLVEYEETDPETDEYVDQEEEEEEELDDDVEIEDLDDDEEEGEERLDGPLLDVDPDEVTGVEGYDLGMDAKDAEAAKRDLGVKVTPPAEKPQEPSQKSEGMQVMEGWEEHFPSDYVPSEEAVKGEERDACAAWFIKLPKRKKDELAPRGWPSRGGLNRKTIAAWRRSRDFAVFAGYVTN